MKSENLTFQIIGGKTPKEMLTAMATGFFEAYRTTIPGGFKVVLANKTVGTIGQTKGRKSVLVLNELPPKELMIGELQEINFVRPEGAKACYYGICDGRKFIVEAATVEQPKPSKRKSS